MSSILPHQVSCSAILAAAMSELFPDAQIQSFQATEKCFFCDVIFPFTFENEMLPLLEERMRGWVKKNVPFQVLEMMPSNAAQFLEHHGNPYAAHEVRRESNTVPILQVGHFAAWSSGKPLATTGGVKFFKLASAQVQGKSVRIIGVSAFSKEELKPKNFKDLPNHLTLMEDFKLLSPCQGGWMWLPRGEVLKKTLLARACQEFSGIDMISTPAMSDKDLILCHSQYIKGSGRGSAEVLKLPLGGEGRELLDPILGTADRIFLPAKEESVISFLQIITKFLKIFAFECEGVIVGKPAKILREAVKKLPSERGEPSGVEFRLTDALGRKWTGPQMRVDERAGVIVLSLFHSLERFVALLLEKTEGKLPFWLQPEQIWILSMNREYAEEVKQALEKAGYRVGLDQDKGALGRSLQERVPFSIVVGDREKTTRQLTIRMPESSDFVMMDLETLMNRLRQLESQ